MMCAELRTQWQNNENELFPATFFKATQSNKKYFVLLAFYEADML
jgi:hypothetical protein